MATAPLAMAASTSTKPSDLKPSKSTVRVRLDITKLASVPGYTKQKELFIQAYAAVLNKDKTDPQSFYQIAGIHGLPYVAYQGVEGTGKNKWDNHKAEADAWGGYCQHGTQLFPTWHRPYMLLLEKVIQEEAMNIAQSYPEGPTRDKYVAAAKELALPYWDWASASTCDFGLPDILTSQTVQIRTPGQYEHAKTPKQAKPTPVPNPLRAFVLPEDLGTQINSSDCFNPTAKPNYQVPTADQLNIFTPKGYSTVRYPNGSYESQVDKLNMTFQTYANVVLRPNLFALWAVDEWFPFSNHSAFGKDTEDSNRHGWYTSIEAVHDSVHVAVGGTGGHMTDPDVAAFDPIFFLHHCNVDRILALWQACHPDAWMTELTKSETGTFTQDEKDLVGPDTELTPFRKPVSTNIDVFYTSNDVRDVTKLNYTYPELQLNLSPADMYKRLRHEYRPDNYVGFRYSVIVKSIPKRMYNGPFTIFVFLLEDPDKDTPLSDPHFAGAISVFARSRTSRCARCRSAADIRIRGSVDITRAMLRLNLLVDARADAEGDPIKVPEKLNKKDVYFITLDKAGHRRQWVPDADDFEIRGYQEPKFVDKDGSLEPTS